MKISKTTIIISFLGSFFISVFFANSAFAAYPIESISLDPARQDFVVGPGKQELFLKPGESVEVEIIVSNRLGEERNFVLETEDFKGSKNPAETVIFLNDQKSPYSLKDYISFSNDKFTLPNGTRARIPVRIKIPADAEPGGLYGGLMVSTVKVIKKEEISGAQGGVPINLRSAVLFFVRVAGETKEDGKLVEFKTINDKKFFSGNEEIRTQLVFENNGSVHVVPYGTISISNMAGKEINSIEIDPWFSLPDSLRSREISFNTGTMIGRYTALAKIYRGYGNIKDASSFDEILFIFWVVPWEKLGILAVIVFVIIGLYRWFIKNFEFKRKKD